MYNVKNFNGHKIMDYMTAQVAERWCAFLRWVQTNVTNNRIDEAMCFGVYG
jgi:hypothetical protein